jgi:hypothetical protein
MLVTLDRLFALELVLASMATFLYFLIKSRVTGAGVPVDRFVSLPRVLSMFRAYREISGNRGWSLWPVYAFWILIFGCLALTVYLGLNAQ